MLPKKLLYQIGIGIVLAVLLFFAYQTFFGASDQSPGLERPSLVALGITPTEPLDQATNEFLQILLSLQKLELNPDFFKNPVFAGLVDFSTELQPQSPGRVNPFAPIGSSGSSAPTASSSPSGTPSSAGGGGADDALRNELLRTLN